MPVVRLHKTVGVKVGRVQVGGGAPIVVQSMTMTDTADARATAAAVHRAGRGRVRDGARHGQPARGGGGGARDQAADARRRLHGAAHRRLPLQRPPAADEVPRLRDGARQVPHQPRQRRHRQAPRRAVLDDLQGGGRPRQAGAHRRQRRLAQPGAGRRARCRRTPTAISARRPKRSSTSAWCSRRSSRRRSRIESGLRKDQIIISCKTSRPRDLIAVYRALAQQTDQPLHLGLTEAGMGIEGARLVGGGDGRAARTKASATRFACR